MNLRQNNIEQLQQQIFDVLIVGGGINGAVSAAALSARGVHVGLIDARDFAGFTSQQSSNLVWGGIKYMEGYEFGLVSGLCKSRNELLESFPSTVKEIRFLMAINKQFRFHPWVILASTWLYWLFGRGKTQTPRLLSRAQISQSEPLINAKNCRAGVEYSDAFLHDNDARFVFNFIRSAIDNGCAAANYVESIGITKSAQGEWITEATDKETGDQFQIRSKILINATGAFVDQVNQSSDVQTRSRHVFSKGIHLIVPRLSEHQRVLAFFADDERLFFAIPMANRTCIGTTDTLVDDPISEVTDEDRDFVLDNINARLNLSKPLSRDDIIAERCGVRPLAVKQSQNNNAKVQSLSRRHIVETDFARAQISIFGGKLTDCINVGDEVCARVSELGVSLKAVKGKWFGEPDAQQRAAFFTQAEQIGLDKMVAGDTAEALSERLWRRYGLQAMAMLEAIEEDSSLTEILIENTGIRRCEIDYLANNEMIVKLEDYLRRRSKIELLVTRAKLAQSQGLMAACEALFGDQAQQKYDEYFDQ